MQGSAAGRLGEAAVRDTIAAVFRQRDYDRSIARSMWDQLWRWVGERMGELFTALRHSPATRWVVIAVLIALGVAVVARAVYVGLLSDERFGRPRRGREVGAGGRGDAWAEAQQLAAAGNYTDAAHALYRALLAGLARRGDVGLHPSKTVGDYGRELRRRTSPVLGRYREFARSYETVVYGVGFCDRTRYERLMALAIPIVQTNV